MLWFGVVLLIIGVIVCFIQPTIGYILAAIGLILIVVALVFVAGNEADQHSATSLQLAAADHKCSPGQHGNPHPGFKPGVC